VLSKLIYIFLLQLLLRKFKVYKDNGKLTHWEFFTFISGELYKKWSFTIAMQRSRVCLQA